MSKNKTVRSVFFAIFCLLTCAGFSRAESGSSKGQVQYKANGGCGTSERTCCPWECESGYHKPRNYTGKLISKTERGCKYSVSDAEDYFYGKYSPALWRNNRAKCNFLNEAYRVHILMILLVQKLWRMILLPLLKQLPVRMFIIMKIALLTEITCSLIMNGPR